MSPRSTRQRERAHGHRATIEAAILDSAEARLSEAPYRELTVEDVMAPLGLGRTAFYRYFPDLDAVLFRRLAQIEGELAAISGGWLNARGEPREDLRVTTGALATLARRHAPLLAALADASASGRDLDHTWRAMVTGFIEPTHRRIEDWIEQGVVELDDAREAAKALVWMTERYLLESYHDDPDLSVELAASTVATIWWRVLFPSATPVSRG
jgi:TetR/AcrR family transcriptional regulator, ethionamide resistance regulator